MHKLLKFWYHEFYIDYCVSLRAEKTQASNLIAGTNTGVSNVVIMKGIKEEQSGGILDWPTKIKTTNLVISFWLSEGS